FALATTLVPQPVVRAAAKRTRLGVLYFGSTAPAMDEALVALAQAGIHLDAMRLRAFPFAASVEEFIDSHDQLFVVEQNRDAQMRPRPATEPGVAPPRLARVLHYDATPIGARATTQAIPRRIHAMAVAPQGERTR